MTQLVYAGIGSRATPRAVLESMTVMASWLARRGWHLHTGGAAGADSAFAAGAPPGTRTLFLPWPGYQGNAGPDCRTLSANRMDRCLSISSALHPAWHRCSPAARKLHARNAAILAADTATPVDAVVAFTVAGAVNLPRPNATRRWSSRHRDRRKYRLARRVPERHLPGPRMTDRATRGARHEPNRTQRTTGRAALPRQDLGRPDGGGRFRRRRRQPREGRTRFHRRVRDIHDEEPARAPRPQAEGRQASVDLGEGCGWRSSPCRRGSFCGCSDLPLASSNRADTSRPTLNPRRLARAITRYPRSLLPYAMCCAGAETPTPLIPRVPAHRTADGYRASLRSCPSFPGL